jgi:putative ABC transport system permease protein
MISLAGRDIYHTWRRFVFTGIGLGLLIGVTLSMAGVYRGMVDDAQALLDGSGADIWVVQKDTLGPYAEPSSVRDDIYRDLLALKGVARAANVTYLTMQVRQDDSDVRVMVVGVSVGELGEPNTVVAGRQMTRDHYEAVADVKCGFRLGQTIHVRRHDYKVVGLTRRMVSSAGDPMLFIPIRDGQEAQFLKDNEAILSERDRSAANPAFNRPSVPGLLEAVQTAQTVSHNVNAILVNVSADVNPSTVAREIERWKHLQAYTRAEMEEILVSKLILTSAQQIGMFLRILAIVTATIVAFIIYTMTLSKIREIAVLKLIGARDRSIVWMILQQALGLGLIGFSVGKVSATLLVPVFPKHVLLTPEDTLRGFIVVMVLCVVASTLAIHAALKVDPGTAIGG